MASIRKFGWGVMLLCVASLTASAAEIAVLRNGFTIRHQRREVIQSTTRLYLNSDPASYVDVPTQEIERFENDPEPSAPAPKEEPVQDLDSIVTSVSGEHHLDPDLVNSVIRAESGFYPHAVSRKGAMGLMQLMPQTASQLGVENAFDPATNVESGSRYLRELLERYNFDLIKALAAYNAGPQRVDKYRGVPPYYETRAYVARIIRDFNRKKLAQEKQKASLKTKAFAPVPARVKPAAIKPLTAAITIQQRE